MQSVHNIKTVVFTSNRNVTVQVNKISKLEVMIKLISDLSS